MWSVNKFQPKSLCEAALSFSTVKTLLSRSTPSFAHFSRLTLSGSSKPKSSCNYLNMFFNEGGFFIPSCTENDKPCASPTP